MVLDRLNAWLAPKGLFFPWTCPRQPGHHRRHGRQQLLRRALHRLRHMVHNVCAIDAILADGSAMRFGEAPGNLTGVTAAADDGRYLDLIRRMRALGAREADEIARRFPPLLRRVGGYNLDAVTPGAAADGRRRSAGPPRPGDGLDTIAPDADTIPGGHNMARLLVGSEGTLGFFTGIELALQPLPAHRVLGVCHFPAFHDAMAATRHIVALDSDRGGAGGPHPDGPGPRHRGVPPHRRTLRARESRRPAAGGVRGRGPRRPPRPASAARRADGRPGLPRRGGGGGGACVPARGLGGAQGGPEHHDVDEGRREADLVRRGLRGAPGRPSPSTPAASTPSSPATAPAAPGTRMPRWAPCTCAPSST